jgi:RNase P protein component
MMYVSPRTLRKAARRAAAAVGADVAVLIVAHEGELHVSSSETMRACGQMLERALNDWRAAASPDERRAATAYRGARRAESDRR